MPTEQETPGCPVPHYTLPGRQDSIVAPAFARELRELRRKFGPVVRTTFPYGGDGWLAIGYEEAKVVFSDPRFCIGRHRGNDYPRVRENDGSYAPFPMSFVLMDPPDHTVRRRVLTRHFSVKRVNDMRPHVRATVDAYLDDVEELGRGVDLVEHFSTRVPLTVASELLGVPPDERLRYVPHVLDLVSGRVANREDSNAKIEAINAYFGELLERRRQDPADDLLSALIHDTDVKGAWSEEELRGIGYVMLFAGHDATAAILGGALYWLAHDTTLYQTLRRAERPDLRRALEEFLRFLPAGTGTRSRIATEDIELGGVVIKEDEAVVPLVHPANFDERAFVDPLVIDPGRTGAGHLRFGFGAHACLGQQLARMEIEEAVAGVMRRFPYFRVESPRPDWQETLLMRGPTELRVAW